jgi:hypothetical protein
MVPAVSSGTSYSVTASKNGFLHQSTNALALAGDIVRYDFSLAPPVIGDPPSIVAQPQSLTNQAGTSATFSVVADGLAPLIYQWRLNGNNLAGASGSSFTRNSALANHTGDYTVVITNAAGSVTSSIATLTITGDVHTVTLMNIWNIQAGSRNYVTTNVTERGIALNPINNHALIVSRSPALSGSLGIFILDADAGTELGTISVAGINNTGLFKLNKIGVAEDGVIYAGNMTTASSTSPFVIYRWADENAVPTLVYSGAPDGGATARWGDSFDVRGVGTNTQIIVGGPSAAKAIIFTTVDGTNFTANPVGPTHNSGRGLAFGDDSFFVKYTGVNATNHGFNLGAGTAPAITNIPDLDASMISIAVDPINHLLAGVLDDNSSNNSGHQFKVYNIADPGSPTVVSNFNFLPIGGGTNSTNPNAVAGVDTDGSRLIALDTQNGVVALKLVYVFVPVIIAQPQSRTNLTGTTATFTVEVDGAAPLEYQWKKNDIALTDDGNGFVTGTTTATLQLVNVSADDDGNYTVTVSNGDGSIESVAASLIVVDPPAIVSQPVSQTNNAGTAATLSVTANGTEPLTFQWKKDDADLADNGNISGATSPTLTLTNLLGADAGIYRVEVMGIGGSATSSNAALVVIDPIITSQPANQNAAQGNPVTFSVAAFGTAPLHYQWMKNNSPLSDGENVSGATSAVLSFNSVSHLDNGNYSVTVSNASGSLTSSNASLTVPAPDPFKPTVSFTIPTKTNAAVIKLTGTAKDTAPGVVSAVWYRLNSTEEFSPAVLGGAPTKPTWESPNIALNPGTNVVSAYAVDASGNHSATTNSKTFFYDLTDLLTVNILGSGEVKSSSGAPVVNGQQIPLLVGRPSSLTAYIRPRTPETNYVFSNWFGSVTSASPSLSFLMQTNMTLTAQFILNPFAPVSGKYNGLFFETNGIASHRTAGFITFNVSSKASFSGKVLLDGNVVGISGKFDLSGHASKTFSRAKFGKSNLTLDLSLDWSTASQKAFGTIGDGTWSSAIDADRATFNATNPAASFVGRYTMLIPRTNYPAASPGGYGYGLITNSLLGKIVLSGKTGDGVVLSQSVPISKDGRWPFYVPLYRNTNIFTKTDYRGAMLGWVTFTDPNVAPTATLTWIKNAVPMSDSFNVNYFYPAGFTNLLPIIASPFHTPLAGMPLLFFADGTLVISDGNLTGSKAWLASVASNNSVKVAYFGADKVTLTLNAKTGLLKGTFLHPNNGNLVTTFFGAIMQEQKYAAGEFAGRTDLNSTTNQTGSAFFSGN